jgi:phosphoglycerate dehydrogenase-like enzyme
LCTPHLGWAEWDNFELYFRECFEQIVKLEKGEPLRLGNPTVKPRVAFGSAAERDLHTSS